MIPRYSRPEMAALWSEEAKLNHWLEIEVLACEGMAQIGVIPVEDAQVIRAKATYDIEKVRENEKRTNHDVIAFLEEVAVHVGGPGRFIHRGLTSSDLLDTTLALQCVASANLLLADLAKLPSNLRAVIVSAYGDMSNIRTAMNRGAFDFVTKPIDLADLELTIKKTLDEIARLREIPRPRYRDHGRRRLRASHSPAGLPAH